MNIALITVFGVVAALVGFVLKQVKHEFAVVISIVAVCGIIAVIISQTATIYEFIESAFDLTSVNGEYIKLLLKASGIVLISHLGSTICKDCGQLAISQQIEIAAKISIILIALPVFTELLKVVSSLS